MKEDAGNFQKLIDDQISDMEETQIFNNYKLFKELLKESTLSSEQIYAGIQKLLIRNYLLMGKEYYTQESLYNRYWIKLEKMLPDTMISDYM